MDMNMNFSDMKEGEESIGSVLHDVKKPKYPSNLKLYLTPDQVKKLGMTDIPEVGEKLVICGACEIVGVQKEETKTQGEEFSIQIQIMGLQVVTEEEKEEKESYSPEAVKKLYGEKKISGSKA